LEAALEDAPPPQTVIIIVPTPTPQAATVLNDLLMAIFFLALLVGVLVNLIFGDPPVTWRSTTDPASEEE
jgi:hypothetical protein